MSHSVKMTSKAANKHAIELAAEMLGYKAHSQGDTLTVDMKNSYGVVRFEKGANDLYAGQYDSMRRTDVQHLMNTITVAELRLTAASAGFTALPTTGNVVDGIRANKPVELCFQLPG